MLRNYVETFQALLVFVSYVQHKNLYWKGFYSHKVCFQGQNLCLVTTNYQFTLTKAGWTLLWEMFVCTIRRWKINLEIPGNEKIKIPSSSTFVETFLDPETLRE